MQIWKSYIHPVQVPWRPVDVALGIKTKFKKLSVEKKKKIHWGQLFFNQGAKQKFPE